MGGLVMLGVSGGVDSSVSAMLLARQGVAVAGMFMQNWEEDERSEHCTTPQDAADAEAVCRQLGIAFHARNFAAEYWDGVFENFLAEYRAGRTPNPDVLCNREIKFKTFLEHAEDLGADRIATGHYAQVDAHDGRWRLLRGADRNKDQTYFLYTLGQAQLAKTLFPIGHLPKPEVRRLAAEAGLPVAAKKDSTGICFIGERDLREFLSRYIPEQPGRITDTRGRVLGEHPGVMFFTLGQRGGLGIGGRRDASGAPWYVVGKVVDSNQLIVDQGVDSPALMSNRLRASQLSWTAGVAPAARFDCTAKTRYRQQDQACRVSVGDGGVEVRFAEAQRAVTPGQSVVFYLGEECLGGGIIDATDGAYGTLT